MIIKPVFMTGTTCGEESEAKPSHDEFRWSALIQRQTDMRNEFIYAVRTTGIFCRPTCSSRLPRRENVRFFNNARDARNAGYRPCRKCRPDESETMADALIRVACQSIERQERGYSLKNMAREVGLSPFHLHRLFRERVGMTPKAYWLAHHQPPAQRGSGSIVKAEQSQDHISHNTVPDMSCYMVSKSTLGWLITAGDSAKGLCFVALGDTKQAVVKSLSERFPNLGFAPLPIDATKAEIAAPPLRDWHHQLLDFLTGSSTGFDIPLDWQGTPFQQRVWRALMEIPHGETRTYAQLAKVIGQPSAVRAVANACGANKLAIVIPCHRVIGSNGQLTGFRWGVERKAALLKLENSVVDESMRRFDSRPNGSLPPGC